MTLNPEDQKKQAFELFIRALAAAPEALVKPLTVKEMAERLGKTTTNVKQLLRNAGKKPVCKDAIYDIEAFESIKDAPPPGRPKKKNG